jgi:hypothetical protein
MRSLSHALGLAVAVASLSVLIPPAPSAETPPEPELEIVSPRMGETVPGPDVPVTFILKNYEVYFDSTRAKGQHIHFIMDNQPYVPLYSAKPYTAKGLAPGTHTIRAFPSREWHESIKNSDVFAMVTFNVGKGDGQNSPDPKKPLLTYSRPKGEYVGHAADSIMVDFWLKNAKLGKDKYQVRLTVDGTPEILLEWKPIWKTGLAMGPHQFKLELLDKDGAAVPGPFNVTERTITLKEAAPADTSAHAH